MEWIDGVPLADPERLTQLGFDPRALARTLIQAFLRAALRDGFFHADMHQGNFFVDEAGRIVAVDFGIMGRLGRKERRFLAEILYGFIRRDYLRVAEVHFEAGYVPHAYRVEDFAQALRAIGEPIHSRTADQISMAKLLTLLFEITALFEMTTRIELVMLQKTMVVVEGVARKLDPQLNMWSTAEPVVGAWIADNLGPLGRLDDVSRGVASLAALLADAPRRLEAIAARLEANASEAEDDLSRLPVSLLGVRNFIIRRGILVVSLVTQGERLRIADNLAPLALFVGRGLSSLAVLLGDAPRRLEEIASRLEAVSRARPSENPYENSPRSRASNTTTFLAIAISLTLMAILWYHWRQ